MMQMVWQFFGMSKGPYPRPYTRKTWGGSAPKPIFSGTSKGYAVGKRTIWGRTVGALHVITVPYKRGEGSVKEKITLKGTKVQRSTTQP